MIALAGAEENHQVHRCKAEGNKGEFELHHHLDYLASYQYHHCHGRHTHLVETSKSINAVQFSRPPV